jgi:hypothetical protein
MLRRNSTRADEADICVNGVNLLTNGDAEIGAKMVVIFTA